MIHYLISHLERSTLNLNIRVGEWFSHQSAKLKREIFNEGSNPKNGPLAQMARALVLHTGR